MPYRLSGQAERDLEDILVEGILIFGEQQALKYHNSFVRTFELLAYMPKIGRKSERNKENEHRFIHGSHAIYYRIDGDEIIIKTIVHGAAIRDVWGDF